MTRSRGLMLVAVLVPLAAVAAGLVSQHVFDMQPCPWCVLQRLLFVVMALVALPGLLVNRVGMRVRVRRTSAAAVLTLALCGVAAALWQHFVAASSTSCNLTLADRIISSLGLDESAPQVFAAYASCADAAVNMAGVPYAFWSLAVFVLLGLVAVAVWRQPG